MNSQTSVHLFLCYTPYHILLANAIIAQQGLAAAKLWVIEDFAKSELILRALDLPISTTLQKLPGVFGKTKFYSRWQMLQNMRTIKKLCKSIEPTEVYIFNDYRPESQVLVNQFKKQTKFNYVEDGYNAYFNETVKKKSSFFNLVSQASFLFQWKPLKRLGTLMTYHKYWFTKPAETVSDFSSNKETVKTSFLQTETNKNWAQKAIHSSGFSINPKNKELFFLPHSEHKENFARAMNRLQNTSSLAKAHVRESQEDSIANALSSNRIVPAHIPAEFWFLTQPQIKKIYCTKSTVSHSFSLLSPTGEVELI